MLSLDGETQLGVVLHVVAAGHDVIHVPLAGRGERIVATDVVEGAHREIPRLGEQRRGFIGQRQGKVIQRVIAGRVLEAHDGDAGERGADALRHHHAPRSTIQQRRQAAARLRPANVCQSTAGRLKLSELHRRRQAIAAFRNGFDDAMSGAVVAQVMPQLGDAVGHRLIGDHDVAPHLPVQRFPRDDFAGTLGQAYEHVHDPRLEAHLDVAPHDAVLARLDEALADTESRLQLLSRECHAGRCYLSRVLADGSN